MREISPALCFAKPIRPAAVYFYSPDRKAERPAAHLQDFRGVLQVDGYVGFERLTVPGDIVLAACWAHARRKFYEVHQATDSPIAAEALRRIAELYAIETTIRGQTSIGRNSARQAKSRSLVNAMKVWLETQLTHIPPRSGLADAIRYALNRWSALGLFLDDGRIELDNRRTRHSPHHAGSQEPPVRLIRRRCRPLGDCRFASGNR